MCWCASWSELSSLLERAVVPNDNEMYAYSTDTVLSVEIPLKWYALYMLVFRIGVKSIQTSD